MNKARVFSALLVTAMLLTTLTGCMCRHEWTEANCLNPKTCNLCGKTEGDVNDAHQWEEATTDAPQTCALCGKTEGEKILVDSRFQTRKCKELFGSWEAEFNLDPKALGLTDTVIPMKMTMYFSNDGRATLTSTVLDPDTLVAALAVKTADETYALYLTQGATTEDVDALFASFFGMTVLEYATDLCQVTVDALTSSQDVIYYAKDGKIYYGESWFSAMSSDTYKMKDGKLLVDDTDLKQTIEFTKVAE